MNSHLNAGLIFIFVFNLFVLLPTAFAQNSNHIRDSIQTYPQVEIPGSEVREFQSDITGQRYFIQIALPRSYKDSQETYQVLYIMDADGSFGTCTEITRLLALGKEVPEMIIIGIAYKVSLEEYLYNRRRDYTPTLVDRFVGSGGGEKFLKFICDELIPFIGSQYRVKKSERVISGDSYGALFALFTLFNKPEMFSGCIAISPSFFWDNGILFKYEQEYYENSSDLPVKLFICAGSLENQETFIDPLNRFTQILNSRGYSGLEVKSMILEGETHYSSFGNAFTKGIKWIFKSD